LCAVLASYVVTGDVAARSQDPHDPTRPVVPPAEYLTIDDQLFDVILAEPGAPATSRRQGATLDSNSHTWNMKYNEWEAGVIPVAFASDISQARVDQFMRVCNSGWGSRAWVMCIHRSSQMGYLQVTQADNDPEHPSGCYSVVGQPRRLVQYRLNLGSNCWSDSTVYHEQGHAFGFIHEHQRPDRDTYVFIDTANVNPVSLGNFTKVTSVTDSLGPYDFMSIMHYRNTSFAATPGQATIIPRSGFGSFATSMGTSTQPTTADGTALNNLYSNYFRSLPRGVAVANRRFDRNDFLDAMERLDAFYYSRMGLNRPAGLSINGGPDFLGIATWIFDIYLACRSVSLSPDASFGVVVADITQSGEWKGKHPTWTSATRGSFTPAVSFDRNEFLDTLQKLNAFYSAPEGLRRPNGLSILGGPDFLGIATWVFDVYLNERLSGSSANVAWVRVMNAIQATDEWKSKH
jgi:hypothetical protein